MSNLIVDSECEDDIKESEKISFKTSFSKEISLYKEQADSQFKCNMQAALFNSNQNHYLKKSSSLHLIWKIAWHLFLLLWYYLDLAIDAYTCYQFYKQSNFNYLWLTILIVSMPVVINIFENLLKTLGDHETFKIKSIFLMVFLNVFMLDMFLK
jgi:hypothetical protein